MKKNFAILVGLVLIAQLAHAASVFDFKVEDINSKSVELSKYKGQVLVIVNTASQCGYTPQYDELEKIFKKYQSQGFMILGFPSNDFGNQEPGSNQEIKKFCDLKTGQYKISFPLFSKSNVKSSPQNPLFSFLTSKANPRLKGDIDWNFEKFLINKKGELVGRFKSDITPTSAALTSAIENELKSKP